MSMTNEQILALKAAESIAEQLPYALEAWEKSNQGSVTLGWIHAANPVAVNSMLAKMESDNALIAELQSFKTAYMEWHDKTDWVQTDKRFDVLVPWGKHRADVLKDYIEHLEGKTLTVDLPHQTDFDDPLSAYEAIEKCRDEIKSACAAAGITLVGGGE